MICFFCVILVTVAILDLDLFQFYNSETLSQIMLQVKFENFIEDV